MDLLDSIMGDMGSVAPPQKKIKEEDVKPDVAKMKMGRIPKKSASAASSSSAATTMGGPGSSRPSTSYSAMARGDGPVKRDIEGKYVPPGQQQFSHSRTSTSDSGAFQTKQIEAEMNALTLSVVSQPIQIYMLDVIVVTKRKEKSACEGPRNDLAKQMRELAIHEMVDKLIRKNPQVFGPKRETTVFDSGRELYSVSCNVREHDGEMKFTIGSEELRSSVMDDYYGNFVEVLFTLRWERQVLFDVDPLQETELNRTDRLKFMEVVLCQKAKFGTHYNFKTKSYSKEERPKDIGKGKVLIAGLDKNVREVGNSVGSTQLVMHASAKVSAFFKYQSVIDLLVEINKRGGGGGGGRSPSREEILDCVRSLQRKEVRADAVRRLKGVIVSTTTTKKPTMFEIKELANTNAITACFDYEGRKISVNDYYNLRYKVSLKYPDAPLAVERKPKGNSYHPLELLKVESGQRVDNSLLQYDGQVDEMLTEARMLPAESKEKAMKQLRGAKLVDSNNEFLNSFGVEVGKKFISCKAKVLTAPTLISKQRTDPSQDGTVGRFPRNNQFLVPAVVSRVAVVGIAVDKAGKPAPLEAFVDSMEKNCASKGIRGFARKNTTIERLPAEELVDEKLFAKFKRERVSIIIFITSGRKDKVHNVIKDLEREQKVVTQHLSLETVEKFCSNGSTTVDNVLMKFNGKLGGVNHNVEPSSKALSRGGNVAQITAKMFGNRMFIGLEMSHAAPQSLFDRFANIQTEEPTVVGMSYNTKETSRLQGQAWHQNPRTHVITNLSEMFVRALGHYAKSSKQLPKEVVVYRTGACDGDFSKIKDPFHKEKDEWSQLEEALRSEAVKKLNGGRPYCPKMAVIVAIRNANISVTPASQQSSSSSAGGYGDNRGGYGGGGRGGYGGSGGGRLRASEANVPSGTCIDSTLVDPKLKEFIMTSQKANIGTSKPTRYVILHDDTKTSLSEWEHVTHYLCHAHQASIMPTHKPHVLYAAAELAKRGRNNWLEYRHTPTAAQAAQSLREALPEGRVEGASAAVEKARKEAEANALSKYYRQMSRNLDLHIEDCAFWS